MAKKVYRAVVYCRLSKEDGDKVESNSIAGQRAYCEDYIAKQSDMKIAHEPIVDDGVSGVSFDRAGFRLLEDEIRKGKVDCIVVRDLSRFARNYIDAGRYLEKIFPQLGVRFIAINDNYDSLTSDPQSDAFVLPFKNLINDTYCKDISMKIRSSLEIKKKNGEFIGAFCPYGYKRDDVQRGQLVVDENACGTVQMIFAWFKDGMSVGRIADKLNQMGVLSPMEYKRANGVRFESVFQTNKMATWNYSSVHRILTNECYVGVLTQGKRGTPNYKVRVIQRKQQSDWVRVVGAHEAIVSLDDFTAVNEMLKRDTRSTADYSENSLSGFLFCGDCGASMVRKIVPAKNKKYVYYVCSAHKREKTCSTHSIALAEIEKKVLGAVRDQIELVLNLENALQLVEEQPHQNRQMFNYEKQMQTLQEEIARIDRLKLRLYEDWKDDVITKAEYLEFKDAYTAMLAEKTACVQHLEQAWQQALADDANARNWVSAFKEYENIEALSRRVLMSLVERILIYENHIIEIVFQYADEYQDTLEYVLAFHNKNAKIAG